ncbi:MAG: UDP-galactopyranose mutase [Bacillariaceae sp.]|jgi:UDP-galactopyranose mutase
MAKAGPIVIVTLILTSCFCISFVLRTSTKLSALIYLQQNLNFNEVPVVKRLIVPEPSDDDDDIDEVQVQEYDVCIAGAGLSGAVIAERYASQLKQSVVIIEKRNHIGGNCYDYIDEETGIRVSQYGAHLFHTDNSRVWKYVQRFSDWTKYEHEVVGVVNGKHVPIPVNIETVNTLFELNITSTEEMDNWLSEEQVKYDHPPSNSEEMALSRVGRRLYELIFHPYTIKQWNKEPSELGPEVTARIPVRNNHDNRYFGDPFQALPTNGYTAIFDNLLCHPNIDVRLDTDYFKVRDTLRCKHTYFTGPIDTYFAHLGYKKLEYRSLDFERKIVRDTGARGTFQPKFVVNHPSAETDFTRIVEYKHLLNQTSDHTILFVERSKDGGEPYYPVPNEENKALYRKYQGLAAKEDNVTFVGRLANYKYFNMDQAIINALELFEKDNGVLPHEKDPIASCVSTTSP